MLGGRVFSLAIEVLGGVFSLAVEVFEVLAWGIQLGCRGVGGGGIQLGC